MFQLQLKARKAGSQLFATAVDDRIAVLFPFDLRLIEIVKTIPGYVWNHKQLPGAWSFPKTPWHCSQVLEVLSKHGFTIDGEIKKCADAKAERPNLHKQLPKGLYPYQKETVEFGYAAHGRFLIGDAPGVGKTAPSIVWFHLFGGKKALVVAPSNVTWKWAEKEIPVWAPGRTVQVVEGGKAPLQDVDILIMSYRTMVMRFVELSSIPFDTMIFDEAHYLKSNKSQQNRVARKLLRGVPYVLMLTGTAYKNRRFELFQLLHMIDPKVWNNAIDFGVRYCGGQFQSGHWIVPPDGETNTEELQERLSHYMIRRTKRQVLKDLPDLTRVSVPVTISNMREYEAALKAAREEARSGEYKPARALSLLNVLRQIVGRGKVQDALDMAKDLLENGEQVVIFAHHKEVVKFIIDGLLKHGLKSSQIGVVNGNTKPSERYGLQEYFLADKSPLRVMVISTAGKEGMDLYSSSNLIFAERLWTPADEEQVEARLDRNGQKNAVTANYLIAKGTIDERLDEIVRRKRANFENLIESDIIREVYMTELMKK